MNHQKTFKQLATILNWLGDFNYRLVYNPTYSYIEGTKSLVTFNGIVKSTNNSWNSKAMQYSTGNGILKLLQFYEDII